MNSYPLFYNEIDLAEIILDEIIEVKNNKSQLNKRYSNIYYKEKNNKLYIQSPLLKFIFPISHINMDYNLYLFLIPNDEITLMFFKLLLNLEKKGGDILFDESNNEINYMTLKSYNIENSQTDNVSVGNQVLRYIKLHLSPDLCIESNDKITKLKDMDLNEINSLINKVDLKLILDIENICAVGNKIAINIKTLKIKILPCKIKTIIDFRDDEEYDNYLLQTEYPENFNLLLNNELILNNLNKETSVTTINTILDTKVNEVNDIFIDSNKNIYKKYNNMLEESNISCENSISVSS
jgi:hypothetical protein